MACRRVLRSIGAPVMAALAGVLIWVALTPLGGDGVFSLAAVTALVLVTLLHRWARRAGKGRRAQVQTDESRPLRHRPAESALLQALPWQGPVPGWARAGSELVLVIGDVKSGVRGIRIV